VLFAIDDDAGVVHAPETIQLGSSARTFVSSASRRPPGLATLRGLADGHELVAPLIVDHDMAQMPGVDFLARAYDMYRLARRVLLVERDDPACRPVVRAMTLGHAAGSHADPGDAGYECGRWRRQMRRSQQEADPKLCWSCGEPGTYLSGSQMYCPKCDVAWMPWSSSSIAGLDEARWNGILIECVDFTKPDALSCPA
jgi:hypothetical protein